MYFKHIISVKKIMIVNDFEFLAHLLYIIIFKHLIYCGLMKPYSHIDLGQHWPG